MIWVHLQTPGYSTPVFATQTAQAATNKEDKQIEILRLQIRLAELTQNNTQTAHSSSYASSSQSQPRSSLPVSQMPLLNSLVDMSTPRAGSGMSSLSYYHDGDRDCNLSGHSHNRFMTARAEDPGRYDVPDGEASSVGVDSWPETYKFAAS